jgi:hypothetical protein
MAQKSQGTLLNVGTANGSTKTITAATAASPVVVTSTAHGLFNGSVVTISGVVGMTELNGRAFTLANQATNTFELRGVDGSAYTAYTSGGIATPKTLVAVGEVRKIGPGFDGEATEIDVTHLRSSAKEYLLGLRDFGNVALEVFIPASADTGQARLRALQESGSSEAFQIALPSGQFATFVALVKSFSFDSIEPDGAIRGLINLRTSGAPAFFS